MGVVSSRHRRLETHSLVTGERRGHSVGTLRQGELVKGRRLQGRKKFHPAIVLQLLLLPFSLQILSEIIIILPRWHTLRGVGQGDTFTGKENISPSYTTPVGSKPGKMQSKRLFSF